MDVQILVTLFCCCLASATEDFNTSDAHIVPDVTNGLDISGNNVCSFIETVSRRVNVSFEQQTLTTTYFKTCCNFWCTTRCTKSRLITKKVVSYRLQTKYFDLKNYQCCSGWGRSSNQDKSCDVPKCPVDCQNGGTCIRPDTCQCVQGFIGKYCSLDEDECKDIQKNDCSQQCINTIGGFKCGCNRGYTLNPDKTTCSDIDECSSPNPPCTCTENDGVCQAVCVNSPGSFSCNCTHGYFLNSARQCEDVNECFVNSNLCSQQCINTPGSYRCGCVTGFVYNGTTCTDIDECLVNNGGCSDTCHNLDGSFACTCPDGFYLTNDGKTCKVIEPTMKQKIICQSEGLGFLDCDQYDEKLIIINAAYGRLTTKYCQTGNFTQNVRCRADNPHQHLTSCNGKSSCVFFFDDKVFGDPCPEVEKYMQIVYDCTK